MFKHLIHRYLSLALVLALVFAASLGSTQTLVASVGAIIRHMDEKPSFDLIVRRSLAEYLALWLEDAAQEYGLEVVGD